MKKNILNILLFSIFFSIVSSCGEYDMSKAYKVNKLEVLAVRTNKPQVHQGDEITAEALIGTPEGYDKEFHSIWLLCVPQKDNFSSCMSEDSIVSMPVIDGNFNAKIPLDVLGEGIDRKKIYLLFTLCEADLQTCSDTISSQDGLKSKIFKFAYKTIEVVNDDIDLTNNNPVIESVFLNGKKLESNNIEIENRTSEDEDSDKYIFKAQVLEDSFDKYKNAKGEDVFEKITFIWKSTEGEIKYYYTNQEYGESFDDLDENPFNPPYKFDGESYKIYLIAIDNRGGVDWKVFNVTPKTKGNDDNGNGGGNDDNGGGNVQPD